MDKQFQENTLILMNRAEVRLKKTALNKSEAFSDSETAQVVDVARPFHCREENANKVNRQKSRLAQCSYSRNGELYFLVVNKRQRGCGSCPLCK